MASGGKKAGKVSGKGRGDQVRWLARDIRQTDQVSEGKPAIQPRPRKLPDCRNCADLCCGLSRALVTEAFELGVTSMSRKVSLSLY